MEHGFPIRWHAVGREVDLAIAQLRSGIEALGKAHHADTGLYTRAFFGLSIGIERLAKLAIIGDYLLGHDGAFPTDANLRPFGHDLDRLLIRCQEFGQRYADPPYDNRPVQPIHQVIIRVLNDFARTTRYYNLDFLSGAVQGNDPVSVWWNSVATLIIENHINAAVEARIETEARVRNHAFGRYAAVFHFR